ncbi:MAG: glycoside hydrolase family 16 protein [Lachnospiraceae bacterium]
MKKEVKKCICVILSITMLIIAPVKNSTAASTHFGDGFDYCNPQLWEKADGWSNEGMFNCTWREANVNFNNGILDLSITNDWSGSKPFAGGEYRTRDKFGYGLYQVNMKPAKNPGIVSSFFTYTGPNDMTPWDEIDIEFLGRDTTKVQFNYYTNGEGNHEYLYNLGFDASEGFHTYGFNWQPGYIAWFVDGEEVYRAYSNIPSNPGKIMLNIWPGINVDDWLGAYDGNTGIKALYDWVSYDAI